MYDSNKTVLYESYYQILIMYIAFRWLVSFTITMWIAMCCIDVFVKKNIIQFRDGYQINSLEIGSTKNKTVHMKTKIITRLADRGNNLIYFYCFISIAGVLVVLRYKRPINIMMDMRPEMYKIITRINAQSLQVIFKQTIKEAKNICSKLVIKRMWERFKNISDMIRNVIITFQQKIFQKQRINFLLLKKLKQIGQEKKNLTQLLASAITENKNIRMKYQLENMAKNRLVKYIENTEKLIKENRSKYVSFQQLYLVTHQENNFLKFRIKNLSQEKADADRNLLELINEIYKSKNSELIAYCSRFIVKSKDNLSNSDVAGEVQRFLSKSRDPVVTSSNWQLTKRQVINVNTTGSWHRWSSSTHITEINMNGSLEPLVPQAPRLKGLPGEYVWTVKDKDGLIEKLYEYDCGSDLDNGETIRRIRKYSVYHDKDCLLDFSNHNFSSSTVMDEAGGNVRYWAQNSYITLDKSLASQRFLTGSEAFKNFMQRNKNVLSSSTLTLKTRRQ